jgi:hypothetical protein
MLAGGCNPGQFFDVRWAAPSGAMRRRFASALRPQGAARLIRRLSLTNDVYVGVALREGRTHGGKSAIEGSHLLYVECDQRRSSPTLGRFAHPPTIVVASGTPGHVHLYWCLQRRALPLRVERANRRLALALVGDLASVDIARVLRPPETLNHKHHPPRAVRLIAYRPRARYELDELVAGLPEPPSASKARREPACRTSTRTTRDRELLAIAAPDYARVLLGREPDRAGKIACPFHEDRRPSLHLYGDGSFYCFGCKRGGTIYDFASDLWGTSTRGQEFLALRKRLSDRFGLDREPRS